MIHETTSLCRHCKEAVPAVVVARGDEVWMEKSCAVHGPQEVRLSKNVEWYTTTREIGAPPAPPTRSGPVVRGCPFDCGACESHTQKTRLPVVTITSQCNLDCPICYVYNKNKHAHHMSKADFEAVLKHLETPDLLNLTGGDPTLHPHILEFLQMAKDAGVTRFSLCTNGIRLVREPEFTEALADLGARVALSFDSFETEADVRLQGAHLVELKLQCLDLLEAHDISTTLIPVATHGVNDAELGRITRQLWERKNIRHVEIHTITYTGQSGVDFDRSGRIGTWEVLQLLEAQLDGVLETRDFVPSPCAHPLCYQVAYLLIDPDGPPIPLTRLIDRQTLYAALGDRLYLEPSAALETALHQAIDEAWANGDDHVLGLLNQLVREAFGAGDAETRLRAAERWIKAVYIHSHMDEETFDVERAAQCCDANLEPDGSQIPVCNYNVLYKATDGRFNPSPAGWSERRGGVKSFDWAPPRPELL